MDQYVLDDITERIDELIELLSQNEDACYVALEAAHQLRDLVAQINVTPDEEE